MQNPVQPIRTGEKLNWSHWLESGRDFQKERKRVD